MKRALVVGALVAAALGGYFAGRAGWGVRGDRSLVRAEEAPVGGLAVPRAIELPALPDAPVRNLILAVGDGMGISELAAARLRAFGPDGRFVVESLPVTALVATHAADRLVAKSDSSATALASGVHAAVGRLGFAADGAVLPSLLERAAAAGFVTGVVTTSQVFDATPAAFYAHVPRRRDYAAIVEQLTSAPLDLVAGGGVEGFDATQLAAARERGVQVALTLAELSAAARLPLWALFEGKTLGEDPAHPTLAELTAKALALVADESRRRGNGFFLLLEEEGIDTAGHDNDLERLTAAALRFDEAVELAARFAASDGATLLVVVGDHATGGALIEDGQAPGTMRVQWGTADHSGEPVALYAYGPEGAQRRFTGMFDLAELGRRLHAALALEMTDELASGAPRAGS